MRFKAKLFLLLDTCGYQFTLPRRPYLFVAEAKGWGQGNTMVNMGGDSSLMFNKNAERSRAAQTYTTRARH